MRPFADKLKRKITPAVRKRIQKTKTKASMVNKSKAGSVFLSFIGKLHWGGKPMKSVDLAFQV